MEQSKYKIDTKPPYLTIAIILLLIHLLLLQMTKPADANIHAETDRLKIFMASCLKVEGTRVIQTISGELMCVIKEGIVTIHEPYRKTKREEN